MHFHFPPIGKVRRLLSPGRTAVDVASERVEIGHADETTTRAAIFLPAELDRITGVSAHSTREHEFARLGPRRLQFAATYLCELRDVIVSSGDLNKGTFRRMVRGRGPRRLLSRIDAEVADAGVFCSTWLGLQYFDHWLSEDFADKVQTRRFGPSTELAHPDTSHQGGYAGLFGLARPTVPPYCLLRKVRLVQTELASSFRVAAWQAMTDRIAERHPSPRHIGCLLVRGTSGQMRLLVNEEEVAEHLRRLGFRILRPASMGVDELLSQLSGSRIVVGVEGSQMTHGFHCLAAPGGMLILQPPFRFGGIAKDRCDRKGLSYAFSVGVPAPGGFRIEIESLDRVLDALVKAIDAA